MTTPLQGRYPPIESPDLSGTLVWALYLSSQAPSRRDASVQCGEETVTRCAEGIIKGINPDFEKKYMKKPILMGALENCVGFNLLLTLLGFGLIVPFTNVCIVIVGICATIIVNMLVLCLAVCQEIQDKNEIVRYIYGQNALKRSMEELTKNNLWECEGKNVLQYMDRQGLEDSSSKETEFCTVMTEKWESLIKEFNQSLLQSMKHAQYLARNHGFLPEDCESMITYMLETLLSSNGDLKQLITSIPIQKRIEFYKGLLRNRGFKPKTLLYTQDYVTV